MRIGPKFLLAVPAVVGLLLAGCAQVSGGGYIESVTEGAKANLGFDLACNENGYLVGTWVFHDKAADPSIRVGGTITQDTAYQWYLECDGRDYAQPPGGEAYFELPFTSQGKDKTTGYAQVVVVDGNGNGKADMKGDLVGITLWGDTGILYTNGTHDYPVRAESQGGSLETTGPQPQPLLGGNLTVTGADPFYGQE